MDMFEYMPGQEDRGPDSMKCMHMISRDRDHPERRGVGVNGLLGHFRKSIRFDTLARPLDWNDS